MKLLDGILCIIEYYREYMDVEVSEILETGDIMIIPLFQGTEKAPNNSTKGLSRSASIAVKSAISSDKFDGREKDQISIWSEECQIILLGVGEKNKLTLKKSRDFGAKCFSNLPENQGRKIVIRFTVGWNNENIASLQKE